MSEHSFNHIVLGRNRYIQINCDASHLENGSKVKCAFSIFFHFILYINGPRNITFRKVIFPTGQGLNKYIQKISCSLWPINHRNLYICSFSYFLYCIITIYTIIRKRKTILHPNMISKMSIALLKQPKKGAKLKIQAKITFNDL